MIRRPSEVHAVSTEATQPTPPTPSLSGKVVLITGASRGLGRALVGCFSAAGASVAFCSRRWADLEPLERDCRAAGHSVLALPCDVRIEASIVRMVHRVFERFGRIDVAVNAAAIRGPRLSIAEHPLEVWRDVLETNLTGAYLVCREVIPYMTQQKNGLIINVADGINGGARPYLGAYLTSQTGLEGLSVSLAHELRASGIRVNMVDPELLRGDAAERIGDLFIWLASDAASHVTGQRLRPSTFAGDVAVAPETATRSPATGA
jgi:NAD(P)-dependent dehydrogenase (short-subunit alcohol dehydrogenase family)